jgi:hypothetical protein
MTSPRRFDQDLPALLAEAYPARTPEYRDDLVLATASVRQRRAWSFLTRWIPMDIAARRLAIGPLPLRSLAIVALLLILAIVAVMLGVGSSQPIPPPFGPARNGPLAYSVSGDLMVRATVDSAPVLLIGGEARDYSPGFSPNGLRLQFVRQVGGVDHLWAANADGSGAIQILEYPLIESQGAWSPDSRSIAVTTSVAGVMRLFIAHVDGAPATPIDVGDIAPTDVAWRPPVGADLLIRGKDAADHQDLYVMHPDGTGLRPLHQPSQLIFGAEWDLGGASWSPAGDRIAFNQVELASNDQGGQFRIHLINADGTGDLAFPGPPSPVQEAWPAWSPDGRSILVHRWTWGDTGEGWLGILPADGSAAGRDVGPRIPGGEKSGLIKAWSPDGTAVLARADNTAQVYTIDPVSGASSEVPWATVDLPDYRRLAP